MNTIFSLITFIISFALMQNEVQFIGRSKTDLQQSVTKEMPGFNPNTFGKNTEISSLKFVDSKTDRTLILFFDKTEHCNYYKIIEEAELYSKRVAEFNSKYKSVGKDQWTLQQNGKNCKVKIEKTEWIITVIYSL